MAAPLSPRLFSIAAGTSFVDALAAGVLARHGDDPAELARVLVLLPTRRACRSLREAFLRQSAISDQQKRALLLPKMVPLGDVDEDQLLLDEEPELGGLSGAAMGGGLAVPPAIAALRRQLLLARLIAVFPGAHGPTEQAVRLAADMARLLDQVQTEELDFARLPDLVADEDLSEHWRITVEFLAILAEQWPQLLAADGASDPAQRRTLLLRQRAEAWRRQPPDHPVIAAGSTGTIPATAALLEVVATLPQGCVVLPGFDGTLSAEARAALTASHPQYGMSRLLDKLGVEAAAVAPWPTPLTASHPQRAALLSAALRPALVSAAPTAALDPMTALAGVSYVECPTPHEEAGVIALMLREALETSGRRAALITPDRTLARRVAAELARWQINIDDSAGVPLSHTPSGSFLRLVARAASPQASPVDLLAMAKHPLASGGMASASFRAQVRQLELAVLRGPRPAPGMAGIRAAVTGVANRQALDPLLTTLERAQRLLHGAQARSHPLDYLVETHVAAAEALAATDQESGAARLWHGEGGEAMALLFGEIIAEGALLDEVTPGAYPELFDTLLAGRVVRPAYGGHPRLAIWGLLEARLQHADLVILGGLNEGVWPPEVQASPWMSRPMMQQFGLPLPERRIGLTAHDFAQAFGAPEVVLTRALRREGAPTTPSRWLLRLDNLLARTGHPGLLRESAAPVWQQWQRQLDSPPDGVVTPWPRPQPRPPLVARPRRLSVTQVETWMRDPYAVYARHILGLRALEPLDAEPGAADYGSLIHQALDQFIAAPPVSDPDQALARLLAIGEKVFAPVLARPGVWAFWWPRFQRIARWFVAEELARRPTLLASQVEIEGRLEFEGPGGAFTLTAKADRIDRSAEGLTIIDYKTGMPPSVKEVAAGFAPQLPIEAVIAQQGGFTGIAAQPVVALEYWRLSGGDPAGERKQVGSDCQALAEQAAQGLRGLIVAFDDPNTPYESRPYPKYAPAYSDYVHLARATEWSSGDDGEDAP